MQPFPQLSSPAVLSPMAGVTDVAFRALCKRYGAGMRQVGVLAAAGHHALDHHMTRLADDHARAGRLARAIADVRPDVVDPASVQTNIVVLDLTAGPGAAALAAAARERGVAVSVLGATTARLVTHLDVDDAGVDRACEVLSELLRGSGAAPAPPGTSRR